MNLSWGRDGLQGGGLQRGRTHAGAGELVEEVGWHFGLRVVIIGELELVLRWAGRFGSQGGTSTDRRNFLEQGGNFRGQ